MYLLTSGLYRTYQRGEYIFLTPVHQALVAERIDKLYVMYPSVTSVLQTASVTSGLRPASERQPRAMVFTGGAFTSVRDYYIDVDTREIRYFV